MEIPMVVNNFSNNVNRRKRTSFLGLLLLFINIKNFTKVSGAGSFDVGKHELNLSLRQHVSDEKRAKEALNEALRDKQRGVNALEVDLDFSESESDHENLNDEKDDDLQSVEEEEVSPYQKLLKFLKNDRPLAVQCLASLSFLVHTMLFALLPKISAGRPVETVMVERVHLAQRALIAALIRQAMALAAKGRRLSKAMRQHPWPAARKAVRNLSLDPAAQYMFYSAIFLAFGSNLRSSKTATPASVVLSLLGPALAPLFIRELSFSIAASAKCAAILKPGLKHYYFICGKVWFGNRYIDLSDRERTLLIGKRIGQLTFLSEIWVTYQVIKQCLSVPTNLMLLLAYAHFIRARVFLSSKVQEAILEMLQPLTEVFAWNKGKTVPISDTAIPKVAESSATKAKEKKQGSKSVSGIKESQNNIKKTESQKESVDNTSNKSDNQK